MAEMTRASRVPNIGTEYNDFLYATIGPENNGILLSVLSAMARLNLDPWQEAANLADLPGKAAASRLASLITSLPGKPSTSDEPGLIAARLIKLLPQRGRISVPLPQPSRFTLPPYLAAIVNASSSKGAMYGIVLLLALIGAQWFFANRPPPASAHTSTAETVSPHAR